jgi:hypothetical protein
MAVTFIHAVDVANFQARQGYTTSIFSPALASPLDRHDRSSLRSASATPGPPFEIEHLGLRAETEPQQEVRPQQRDVMAGSTIDLDEIASPEILDPRQVEGLHIPNLCSCIVLTAGPTGIVNTDRPREYVPLTPSAFDGGPRRN